MKGKVTLIGAGIGTGKYMTLRGYKILKNAEVVVYDRLLGEGVMDMIPENAEKINAGKESSNHLIPQEEINNILVNKALEGKNVVRLKGGDSYLFGRGGEEVEALREHNIDFEVVPGITSSISAPAFAGIPVTHRDCASSVHIITGHNRRGKELSINYKACVEIGGTLVFLMGIKNMGIIAEGLISAGMSADMPCAVIENGGSPNQKKVISTISKITDEAKDLKSPSVIVVGEVCRYSDDFDWFSNLPLKGKNIIITRPKEMAVSLVDELRALGASVVIAPSIITEPAISDINKIIQLIKEYSFITFTSAVGVRIVFNKIFESGLDSRIFANSKIAAIGKRTGQELLKYGIRADIIPERHYTVELGKALVNAKAENVLILRTDNGSEELTDILKKNNVPYKDIGIYKTLPYINDKVEFPKTVDYVVFASASEVRNFACNKLNYTGVCIGEKTAEEARKYGISCIVAKKQSNDGIVECIIKDVIK